ncbi:MAG: substrate-binding domain-containing protein, partial [Firmicutes bacterium]|nr:substrate-binding domain-containing protein [Bacillota bacterium]
MRLKKHSVRSVRNGREKSHHAGCRRCLRIPEDVMITGFDGSPEASLVDPCLTTVSIQSSEIGKLSADVLNSMILQPDRPYRRVF